MASLEQDLSTLRGREDYQSLPRVKQQAWEQNLRAEHGEGSVIPEVAAGAVQHPTGLAAIHPAFNPESWSKLGGVLKEAALPVGGAILGGPGGGMLGETLNQAWGITPPSTAATVMSGIAPGAGNVTARGINAAPRLFGRALPGSSVAAHDLARQDIIRSVERAIPDVDVNAAYAKLEPFKNVPIDTPELLKTMQKMEKEQTSALPIARSEGIRGPIAESIAAVPEGKMTFEQVRQNLKLLGAKTEGLQGPELGAYKSFVKALNTDLENMAGKPSVPPEMVAALKEATGAAKQMFAKKDMQEILARNIKEVKTEVGAGTATQVNATDMLNQFRKQMREDKNFAAVWKPQAQDVEGWFQEIAKIPRIPPPPSAQIGSGRILGKMGLGAGLTAGSATYMGLDPALSTIMAGMGGYAAIKGPQLLASMLMTPGGRQVAKYLLTKTGGYLDPSVVAGMSAYLYSGAKTAGTTPDVTAMLSPSEAQASEIRPPQAVKSFTQRHAEILSTLPKDVQAWMKARPEASMTGILSNMRSMTPDEQQAYGRSLVSP